MKNFDLKFMLPHSIKSVFGDLKRRNSTKRTYEKKAYSKCEKNKRLKRSSRDNDNNNSQRSTDHGEIQFGENIIANNALVHAM